MNPNDFPRVWPDLIPSLQAALLKYEEGVANMAEFKKKYTSVKRKAKRVEKYLVSADEETRKYYEFSILDKLRLTENKFALIDKKLKRFKEHEQKYCNQSLKLLKGPTAMDPNNTRWHIQKVAAYPGHVNGLIRDIDDMLRIAKEHLTRVDEMKKYLAQLRRRRQKF